MFNFGNIVLTNFIPILAVVLITIIRIVEARRKKIAQQKNAEPKREIIVSQTQEEDEEDRIPPWIKELQTQEEKPEEEISIVSIAKIEHIEQKPIFHIQETPSKIEEKKSILSSKITRYSPLKQGLIWSEVLGKPKGLD